MNQITIHSGQHYDPEMKDLVARDLGLNEFLSEIDCRGLDVYEQIGQISKWVAGILQRHRVSVLIVYGDVTTTLAGAIASKYCQVKLVHVESGLRAKGEFLPEEINRIIVDSVSNLHFATTEEAKENLISEGVSPSQIYHVGNTMIDSLKNQTRATKLPLIRNPYGLVTIHRQANLESVRRLNEIVEQLEAVATESCVLWPMHPRTRKVIEAASLLDKLTRHKNIEVIDALGYLDFMTQLANSSFVITDSGGVQEEAAVLGLPTIVVRNDSERLPSGSMSNALLSSPSDIYENLEIAKHLQRPKLPSTWDGNASERLVDKLQVWLSETGKV